MRFLTLIVTCLVATFALAFDVQPARAQIVVGRGNVVNSGGGVAPGAGLFRGRAFGRSFGVAGYAAAVPIMQQSYAVPVVQQQVYAAPVVQQQAVYVQQQAIATSYAAACTPAMSFAAPAYAPTAASFGLAPAYGVPAFGIGRGVHHHHHVPPVVPPKGMIGAGY